MIQIVLSEIIEIAKRKISLIAKRSQDKQGQVMYEHFTFSSAEQAALEDFAQHGVANGVASVVDVVSNYKTTEDGATMDVANTRSAQFSNYDFSNTFKQLFYDYVAAYTSFEFLSAFMPTHAQLLSTEMVTRLNVMKKLVCRKSEPGQTWTKPASSEHTGEITTI